MVSLHQGHCYHLGSAAGGNRPLWRGFGNCLWTIKQMSNISKEVRKQYFCVTLNLINRYYVKPSLLLFQSVARCRSFKLWTNLYLLVLKYGTKAHGSEFECLRTCTWTSFVPPTVPDHHPDSYVLLSFL